MLDKGSARSRSTPRVTFILAERGTCFALWKDTIDNLSNYKISGPTFHTMCLSTGMHIHHISQKNDSNYHIFILFLIHSYRSQQTNRIQFRRKRFSDGILGKCRKTNQ